MPIRDWLWLVPVLIVAEFVGFGLSMAIEPAVIDSLFGWLPDWFVRPIDPDRVGDYSREAWLVTLAAYLVLNGFVGPIVEELYFRGYLLPRMEWMGRWAPLVNVSLFSLYHFWSPWQCSAGSSRSARRSMPCAGRRTSTSAWSSTARGTRWASSSSGASSSAASDVPASRHAAGAATPPALEEVCRTQAPSPTKAIPRMAMPLR